jgi:hypothetical protein
MRPRTAQADAYFCLAIPSIPRSVDTIYHIPMDCQRGPASLFLSPNRPRARMVYRFVHPPTQPHTLSSNQITNSHGKQSHTPSASTSSTSSSPSSHPNSTPPSPKTKVSKTAKPVARPYPSSRTTNSAHLSAACPSSNSGTRRLAQLRFRLCVRGSRFLIFQCFGRCWLCIG